MSETHPELAAWLARQEAEFPAWAEATGTPKSWDFSPASLDVLEIHVRRRYTDANAVNDDVDSTFIQVAIWYIGEVARRVNDGAAWHSLPPDPTAPPGAPGSPQSIWTRTPRVALGPAVETPRVLPLNALRALLLEPEEDDDEEMAAELGSPLRDALSLKA
ncbi:hypothetical protein OG866_43035 [Streptomyces sp. NBC_00663]|uniref:hypothetical protein n=1 Tax=Streptomyces sp. NBC_00663 TaxID=2975801 RepID=UPI002E331E55|nr:hypothetical protein [Streptomyces sp. NBC_00663]